MIMFSLMIPRRKKIEQYHNQGLGVDNLLTKSEGIFNANNVAAIIKKQNSNNDLITRVSRIGTMLCNIAIRRFLIIKRLSFSSSKNLYCTHDYEELFLGLIFFLVSGVIIIS